MNTEYKMCVKQWTKRHSHLTRPSFPLDRRQSQGLSGEYLPPWPQTESEVKDLTVEWSRDIWILAILHTQQLLETAAGQYNSKRFSNHSLKHPVEALMMHQTLQVVDIND